MKSILTIALTFCFSVSFSQLVTVQLDEYPLARFEEWNNSKEYTGTYTLGFSEQSWEVTFIGDQNMATIQTTLHVWNGEDYEDKTNTYSGIKIKGNKAYYRDGTLIIEFVKFIDTDNTFEGGKINGILYHSYNTGTTEFGFHYGTPEAASDSTDTYRNLLTTEELANKSRRELKIMRNKIFAKYGYRFIEGGEMDKYFRSQDWYKPTRENVDKYLTDIEKANIKLIQAAEKQ